VREGWGKKKGRESILLDSSLAGGQSFGLVTATPLQYGRLSLPCAQSGRRSDDPVSQGPRLRRLREGPAPSQGLATDVGSELLPDAQPLAPGPLAGAGLGLVGIPALADGDAHAA
jgi:hypothetical protein